MDGTIVGHWQLGPGIIVSRNEEMAVVLFEKDNRERPIALENLTSESGKPLISPQLIGRDVKTERAKSEEHLYEYIREAGHPVFTDYPSAAKLVEVLKSRGANVSSAGTISSMASSLKKRGMIRYAEGVKGSGWIAVPGSIDV